MGGWLAVTNKRSKSWMRPLSTSTSSEVVFPFCPGLPATLPEAVTDVCRNEVSTRFKKTSPFVPFTFAANFEVR